MWDIASIIILGIIAQWISWRLRLPAILPLILIGLAVGPISTLFTEDGSKWIEPVYQVDTGHGLFPGKLLFYFVSLAIGIILFEGGLTLKRKELAGVGGTIAKLITIGSTVTFLGGAVLAHYIMGLNWQISLLFGALIIVTGPTVIAPILRNLPLNRKVATVLKWEGILIDPIGALVAVLVFEFIRSGGGEGQSMTLVALEEFGKIILIGGSFGFTFAYSLAFLIRQKLIPHYLLNVVVLAMVLSLFVISDALAHESGLLAVVVMGLVFGNMDTPEVKTILDFKESLSVLLISVLFILLSANIDIAHLMLLYDWRCLVLFAVIVFVLRPLGVYLSTGKELSNGEKGFIGWVGPRGIVAAGIASLFGLGLTGEVEGAEYVTPLVFMIVMGTVLLVAITSRTMARWMGVLQGKSNGIMIVGINEVSRVIAKYIMSKNRDFVLVDNNNKKVNDAKDMGLNAVSGNIYSDDFTDNLDMLSMGYIMAMTSSQEVNDFACDKFHKDFGEEGTYRLVSPQELKMDEENVSPRALFSIGDDFINVSEVVRDYPTFHEVPVSNRDEFDKAMVKLDIKDKSVPLFLLSEEDELTIIPVKNSQLEIKPNSHIVYIGKTLEF